MNKNNTEVCSIIERSLVPHSLQRCVMECVLLPPHKFRQPSCWYYCDKEIQNKKVEYLSVTVCGKNFAKTY
jgi:hypothetical protein